MHYLLDKISNINEQLTQLVDSKNWENMLDLSRHRDQLLREYFAISPLPDDNSVISSVIVRMTNSDQEIKDWIAQHKKQLINESLSLKKSHQAISRYQTTQSHQFQIG